MASHVLFEEDGAFKAGSVLSATDSSMQVELASGKRTKVKASHVLLRFEQPAPGALLTQAAAAAEGLDLDFLWECAPKDEFGFDELAREYFGGAPDAVQAATVLLRLHGAPVYFHRKGRGRYRPAPADMLQAALAALERKREQERRKAEIVAQLKAGVLPAGFAAQAIGLLVKPDKNGIEFKAVEQAAAELKLTPLRLLLARGAVASPYRWHLDSFLFNTYPRGAGFASDLPAPDLARTEALPLAAVTAFSIDDSATTEIDDAFSVQPLDGGVRVGIHIAAPGAVIARDHPLDAVARTRMSTVYAPGMKITMLPAAWIEAFSLDAGRTVPVLSLYVDWADDGSLPQAFETKLERVQIVANLRHDRLDDVVTPEAVAAGQLDTAFGTELLLLHRLARVLLAERERVRGKPEPVGRVDWSFVLDGEGEAARVDLRPRRRGAPLDLIVAELMILANSHWGGRLAEERRAGIYRSQSWERGVSRVKMSTVPAAHEGMGVRHYAWSSSPLRRYVDLVNQRQLIAATAGAAAPYPANDADLFAIISAFDAAYGSYAEFQERMERYWCLRWVQQEGATRLTAAIVKGDLLRLDGMPMLMRLPGLPELPRGQRVALQVLDTDLVDLVLQARLAEVLDRAPAAAIDEDDEAVADEAGASEAGADDAGADDAAADDAAADDAATQNEDAADADNAQQGAASGTDQADLDATDSAAAPVASPAADSAQRRDGATS
jgi:exoribonuclease-2